MCVCVVAHHVYGLFVCSRLLSLFRLLSLLFVGVHVQSVYECEMLRWNFACHFEQSYMFSIFIAITLVRGNRKQMQKHSAYCYLDF